MTLKAILGYLWKLPLCGVAFLIGMIASGMILPLLGLQAPAMPQGADANTVLLYYLLGSLFVAVGLSLLSRELDDGFVLRWLMLGLLSWVWNGVSIVLEAGIFMTTGAVSSGGSMVFTMLSYGGALRKPRAFLPGCLLTTVSNCGTM